MRDQCVKCGRFTFKGWLYCQKCADQIEKEYMEETVVLNCENKQRESEK